LTDHAPPGRSKLYWVNPPALPEQALDDAALAEAVLRKDRKATAEFVARFSDSVYSYLAWRLLPREDLVDDLFQHVFLEAWRGLPRWNGSATLGSWLLGIARHKVQDHYRRRLREADMPDDAAETVPDGRDLSLELMARVEHDRVERTLAQLPEASRLLLLWRYWDQQTAGEMATATGKTVKGVERALSRARDQFRALWQEGGTRG
jgi:RNA polymerase sigma-70 factor, ECF subfamily